MFEHSLQDRLVSFMYGVYALMSGALSVTAVTAYMVSRIPNIEVTLFGSPMLMMMIFLGQLALVIAITAMINRLTFPMALAMFFVLATSMGVTLSSIFLVYTDASIVQAFAVAAGMFGVMTIYGYITGTDLTKIGNIAIMGLIGLIIAGIMNYFIRSPQFDLFLSATGVLIFTALIAYKTQSIKRMGEHMMGDNEMLSKIAVVGALSLYLSLINLFLSLLRFMGRRRD